MDFSLSTVEELIRPLLNETEYGSLEDFYRGEMEYRDSWLNEIEDEFGIEVSRGETKLVIFSPALNGWVLKIPCLSYCLGAEVDFCKIEVDNYEKAKKAHLERFFVPAYFIGKFYDIPVYAQEKVECEECVVSESFYEWAERNIDKDDYDDEEMFYDAVFSRSTNMCLSEVLTALYETEDSVSGEEIDELFRFCLRNEINDLHSGNWGYTKTHFPVCVDYSGFQRF